MKFLFYSPHALTDSSSGAARSVSALLAELVALGHDAFAVTGTIADQDNQLLARLLALPAADVLEVPEVAIKRDLRKVRINGVEHCVVCFDSNKVLSLLAVEEALLAQVFRQVFDEFQPHVVLTFGGFSSNYLAGFYARDNGSQAVLYAATHNYVDASHFNHVDKVVTPSVALRRLLDTVSTKPKLALSSLVRREDVLCRTREPEFITFINPTLSKGLMLILTLARECQKQHRPYRFLVVESRGTRATLQPFAGQLSELNNLMIGSNTADVRLVYEKSKIILFPSLGYESAGGIPIEANINGIPVLASDVGGIAEMLDGAGYLFDPPQSMLDDFSSEPPAEYTAQWLRVIDRLFNDDSEMADAVRRAQEADGRYDVSRQARQFVDFVSV
jgi:glycosyltransferase involved in cell wall biosynthesis